MKINITIKELIKSFKLFLLSIKTKKKLLASKEVVNSRRNKCNNCEFLVYERFIWLFPRKKRCGICTCFINSKTKLKFEKCPKNKW